MESFEHMGYWWLPREPGTPINKTPDTAIPGKLTFDAVTGGVLELLGNLDSKDDAPPYGWRKYEIIHGFVDSFLQCVTVTHCLPIKSSPGNVISKLKLSIGYIFTGRRYWFDTLEDIRFEKLTVGYTYLNEWFSHPGFEINWDRENNIGLLTPEVSYSSPEPIVIELDKATVEFWSAPSGRSSSSEVCLKNELRISVDPKQTIYFDDHLKFINFHLANFMTLATGCTNFPVNLNGLVSDNRDEMTIHYKLIGFTEKRDRLSPWSMLFSYDDVREGLPIYISNWIDKSEKLEAATSLFFRQHYSRLIVLDSELLILAQALEAYHRQAFGGEYLTADEYEPIRTAIIEAIEAIPEGVDRSHRDALAGMIRYGNQYSLRRRLKEIVGELSVEHHAELQKLLGDPGNFIHRLVETRNYFTHRDGVPNSDVLRDDELYEFTRRMRMFLQICFLKEMELPTADITRLLNKNQTYYYLSSDKSAQ